MNKQWATVIEKGMAESEDQGPTPKRIKGFRGPSQTYVCWLKSNIRTILVLPESGRLRFPLNIWVGAGGWGLPHTRKGSQQSPSTNT